MFRYIRRFLSEAILPMIMIPMFSSCTTGEGLLKEPGRQQSSGDNVTNDSPADPRTGEDFTPETTVGEVIADPAFGDFGRLLFPVDRNIPFLMTLAQVSTPSVYVWYPYIRVEKTVEILNYLREEVLGGRQIFHSIYTPQEIAADPSKADTGIFVFKGKEGQPFGITNAGGGFAYVGAMHDSFPHSLELCRAGYTAFALIYRPDDHYTDLARAITYILDNAEALGVSREGYSLWGGSAGARMAATLGNSRNLRALTGDHGIALPAAVIMQYTGYSTVSEYDAPTYSCVGTDDGIASWRTMQRRLQQLSALGIPTEFHVYEGLGHGFGIGTGTVAEGWIRDAVRFWEANMPHHDLSGISLVEAH